MGLIGRRDLPLAPDPRSGFEMVLLRMLAFRPADSAASPRPPLKPVGISQATVDSARSVAGAAVAAPAAAPVAPVVAPVVQAPVAVEVAAPIAEQPVPVAVPVEAAPVAAAVVVAEVPPPVEPVAPAQDAVDLPWNDPVEPEVVLEPAAAPLLETVAEQPALAAMPLPTPDSVVPDAPEWVAATLPEPTPAQVDAATPGLDMDDEPPLDEDYIEPDMDSAYSYLDELASEHAADPAPEPEPQPAAAPATGLALEWLELFPKLPVSGMTGSIAANCTLIAVSGDDWLLHLDPAHSALFNATQQRRLNDALNQYHGRPLKLSIELIKPEQETPAQAASRRRHERQDEAVASIHADPFIQQMMQQFGAVIRGDTIEPVDVLVTQD